MRPRVDDAGEETRQYPAELVGCLDPGQVTRFRYHDPARGRERFRSGIARRQRPRVEFSLNDQQARRLQEAPGKRRSRPADDSFLDSWLMIWLSS